MLDLLKVKKLVESYYNIKDISIKKRSQVYVDARTVYIVLAKRLTNYNYTIIGEYIKRDHSSVTHAINSIYSQWKNQFYYFRGQLDVIESIHQEIAGDPLKLEVDEPIDLIVQSLRAKIILKDKEIKELIRVLELKDKKILELKKYEPVW